MTKSKEVVEQIRKATRRKFSRASPVIYFDPPNWHKIGFELALYCRDPKTRFFVSEEMAELRIAQINMVEK